MESTSWRSTVKGGKCHTNKRFFYVELTLLAQVVAAYAAASCLLREYVSSSLFLYFSVSPSSLAKLLTVFMQEKVSVATWLALASDS